MPTPLQKALWLSQIDPSSTPQIIRQFKHVKRRKGVTFMVNHKKINPLDNGQTCLMAYKIWYWNLPEILNAFSIINFWPNVNWKTFFSHINQAYN